MPRLIAEWEPQSAILLTWPHDAALWKNHFIPVQQTFCRITQLIAQYQSVWIICKDEDHRKYVQNIVRCPSDNIQYRLCNSDDCWSRDHAPISIDIDSSTQLLDFSFNGWGNQFPFHLDNQINQTLFRQGVFGPLPMRSIDFILEGGSIDCDGQGTLLTTEKCLLSPLRNGSLNQRDIAKKLSAWLGIQKFHWLKHGTIIGDDTGGHIDTLARFCHPDTIAYSQCEDKSDEHYASLNNMQNELKILRQINKQPYSLVPLPIPKPIYNQQGKRLPATYVNFLISNRQVLVPIYQDGNDSVALERLDHCFPDRIIEPVDALPLIHQGGSLHCVTMQFPAVSL